jgi:hypothetical protein
MVFVSLAAGTAWAKDACSLVTAGDVRAVIGEEVHQVPAGIIPPSGPGLEYSSCRFKTASKTRTVSLLARYSKGRPNDSITELVAKMRSQKLPGVREISGVGDGAVWDGGPLSKTSGSYQLTFMKGKFVFLLITLTGSFTEAGALEQAKALAAKILPRA